MPALPKTSNEQIAQALKETNGLVSLAARRLGVSYNTVQNRVKATAYLQEIVESSRVELVDLAEAKFKQAILAGEPWAVAMALKTIGKKRGYTERVEVTGEDGGAIEVIHVRARGKDESRD